MNVPDAHGIGLNTIIALLSLFSLLIVFGMNYIRFPTDIISAIGKKNNDKNKTKLKRDLLFFFFIVDLFGIGLVFELWLIFLFHSIFIFTDLGCISKFIIPLVSFIWIIYLVCRGIKLRKEQMKDWKPKYISNYIKWTIILLFGAGCNLVCFGYLFCSDIPVEFTNIGISLLRFKFLLQQTYKKG